MEKTQNYHVMDMSLSGQGLRNIEWAETQMQALLKIRRRFENEKPFAGKRIGIALHPTKETAVLVRTLVAGGADVAICACNPLSTQDDVAAALASEGIKIYAWKGQSKEDYYNNLVKVVEFKPHITIDDGCDLVTLIHQKYPSLIPDIIGGCEETTTGIIRLKAMENDNALKYPMVAVNNLNTKHLFDNYYGTGQSAIDGLVRATNILLAGLNFVVCGYGPCGKGVAARARGMGANVIVTEVDNFRALQAKMDGFRVMPISKALSIGDVYLTVTGNKHVISFEHMKRMKRGAIIANAGHFDLEIEVDKLQQNSRQKHIRPFMTEYDLGETSVYVLAEGRLVNLSAAEGHPSVVMAMSFCGQSLCAEWLVKNKFDARVIEPPLEIDNEIARLQLESMGVDIDALTTEQSKYLSSWQEGT